MKWRLHFHYQFNSASLIILKLNPYFLKSGPFMFLFCTNIFFCFGSNLFNYCKTTMNLLSKSSGKILIGTITFQMISNRSSKITKLLLFHFSIGWSISVDPENEKKRLYSSIRNTSLPLQCTFKNIFFIFIIFKWYMFWWSSIYFCQVIQSKWHLKI